MKTRLIKVIKKNVVLISLLHGCRCQCGRANKVVEVREVGDNSPLPSMDSFNEEDWPTVCDKCGIDAGREGLRRSLSTRDVYDKESGKPEPGDLFYRDMTAGKGKGCLYHVSGCDGMHLYAVLPNGRHWDIDGRATNCTRPDDDVHRCWVRQGEPPNVTAGKDGGDTCSAGAGSIASGDYHGFLRNGSFT